MQFNASPERLAKLFCEELSESRLLSISATALTQFRRLGETMQFLTVEKIVEN